jgi:hypothetical protein
MAHQEGRPAGRRNENVLNFARSSAPGSGARALDLVYQAAEVFSGIEDSAREIEARAKAMCKDATERLRHAEQRVASAEHTLREVVVDADGKLQDASRALTQAETRISAAETGREQRKSARRLLKQRHTRRSRLWHLSRKPFAGVCFAQARKQLADCATWPDLAAFIRKRY